DGACLSNLVPALMAPPGRRPAWLPDGVRRADQVVLLVLDGLGWQQLADRRHLAPAMASMAGGSITSVVPTTTATALTSIAMGSTPAAHGVVGYRVRVLTTSGQEEVLNVLRWRTASGDAREAVPPATFSTGAPFAAQPVPVVTRDVFEGTGFTRTHLAGVASRPWHQPSSIPVEVGRALRAGSPLVYAYYDGVDSVAHLTGLGEHYDAELRYVDRLVADVAATLPPGAALAVTADHGQVDVGGRISELDAAVLDGVRLVSGEGRFRWLHARPGAAGDVLDAAADLYGEEAWVRSVDHLDAESWFGGPLEAHARDRLGDVAVVPHRPIAYVDPQDRGDARLVCRHGSLTADEMLVPLIGTVA
ncbi:MAG TPA: alkaline phosphatase family protein, partial [Acidimicrobiales bacterium]|nr:alkaline phosphatase family protein [Acidimicrobiales bacterium]